MTFVAYGATDIGKRREHNEDAMLLDADLGLAIVCDGVGGHAAGEVASEMACAVTRERIAVQRHILDEFLREPNRDRRIAVERLVENAINDACAAIYNAAQADRAKKGMGTTIVLLLRVGGTAILAHVGDSRIYLLRRNAFHQLTEDHSLVAQQLKRGLITAEQAATVPYGSMITRAVGFQSAVQVDVLAVELAEGDRFLLCSDGLCDNLQGDEFARFCTSFPLAQVPDALVRFANDCGGRDNITAVVVAIESQEPDTVEAHRKVELLQRIPLFRHLTYQEINYVMSAAVVKRFAPGDLIIREGDVGGEMFVMLTGKVNVVKSGHILSSFGAGSFFGEMGLLDSAPRSASVEAVEPSSMLALPREHVFEVMRQQPELAVKLLWAIAQVLNQRLRRMNNEVAAHYDDNTIELTDDDLLDDKPH